MASGGGSGLFLELITSNADIYFCFLKLLEPLRSID